MRFAIYLAASAAVASAISLPVRQADVDESLTCDVEADQDFLDYSEQMRIQESSEPDASTAAAAAAVTNVDIWFHVVAVDQTPDGGWVSDDKINQELANLNNAFEPHGFHFAKQGITRTVNVQWSTNDGEVVQPMGQALRKGQANTLNVYIVKSLGKNAGVSISRKQVCTIPRKGWSQTNFPIGDGCRIKAGGLPPSTYQDVLIHETGHWFGLLHTFAGNSCSGPGDHVDDTPAHLKNKKCDEASDTCPGQPGRDPVHNYMNYTPPGCLNEFTKGQEKRMRSFWKVRTS
ncbi:MAG: hypothetical protein Q9160_006675 [Pyrenula sp. 1 TL-2023]